MKKYWYIWLIAALTALFCILGIFVFKGKAQPDPCIELWYSAAQIDGSAVEKLVASYDTQRREGSMAVQAVEFSTEEELAQAMELRRPALLLCSYSRAASLGSRGLLPTGSQMSRDYKEPIPSLMPFAGSSFFPLGGSVPLLACQPEAAAPASAQELLELCQIYQEQNELPALSSVSPVCSLLDSWSAALGYEMKGELELDAMSTRFRQSYDLLAQAAKSGAFLPPCADSAALFSAGKLPYAFLPSSLCTALPDAVQLCPLPLPEGSAPACTPDVLGIALMNGDSLSLGQSQAFIAFVLEQLEEGLALDMGLVPLSKSFAAPSEEDLGSLESLLLELRDTDRLLIHSCSDHLKIYEGQLEKRITKLLLGLY